MTQSPLNAAMLRQLADLWHRYDKHAGGWRAPCFRDVLYAEATRLEAAQQGGGDPDEHPHGLTQLQRHEEDKYFSDGSGKPELMTQEQIKRLVDRFLNWKLPENFNPDGGISFKKTFNDYTIHPMKHEPSGTNLLDATQAEAMVRYMIDGLAEPGMSYVSREWLRNKISTDPDVETEAGVSHPEAPSPTPEAQHPLSAKLDELNAFLSDTIKPWFRLVVSEAKAALNEMTKERDRLVQDNERLTMLNSRAFGSSTKSMMAAEAAESQLSLARAVVEAARWYRDDRINFGNLMEALAAYDAAYPQQDKE